MQREFDAQAESDGPGTIGVWFDVKLMMDKAIHQVIKKASPKLTALQRTKWYYSIGSLFDSSQAHILSLLEYSTPGIYHASDTLLAYMYRGKTGFCAKFM